jgi:hypothetical protein
MSATPTRVRFPDLATFYRVRGGARSGESDFGVLWTDGSRLPLYRVSVVHDTGDVIAVAQSGSQAVELLRSLGNDCVAQGLSHSSGCSYQRAERLLAGWADGSRSLDWARGRIATA